MIHIRFFGIDPLYIRPRVLTPYVCCAASAEVDLPNHQPPANPPAGEDMSTHAHQHSDVGRSHLIQ